MWGLICGTAFKPNFKQKQEETRMWVFYCHQNTKCKIFGAGF